MIFISSVIFISSCVLLISADYSYNNADEWANEYPQCSGSQQSPIDVSYDLFSDKFWYTKEIIIVPTIFGNIYDTRRGKLFDFFTKINEKMPEVSEPGSSTDIEPFALGDFFDKNEENTYMVYNGSLTHPPWSESITWFIANVEILVSSAQNKHLKMKKHKTRGNHVLFFILHPFDRTNPFILFQRMTSLYRQLPAPRFSVFSHYQHSLLAHILLPRASPIIPTFLLGTAHTESRRGSLDDRYSLQIATSIFFVPP
ncbi:hypothetical protein KQX54_007776 [Cotesia glomerata]|uniref:carbonic anhydrase n=1 Tax=Cotesia glomerata TaxID=32391 RepID=A0AAV7J639_COTGL|nr:hypothetical protein KQX54_007776 [Cotesia glomerata]